MRNPSTHYCRAIRCLLTTMFFVVATSAEFKAHPANPAEQSGRRSPDSGIRSLLANQPDHEADVDVTSLVLGGADGHVIKKGSVYRLEISRPEASSGRRESFVVIDPQDKAIIGIYPAQKTYTIGKLDTVLVPVFEGSVQRFLSTPGAQFKAAGDEEVDGHKCAKIVAGNEKGDIANFFVARDLKNLVVKIEILDKTGVWLSVGLKNISLNVSKVAGGLFEIPPGYTEQ